MSELIRGDGAGFVAGSVMALLAFTAVFPRPVRSYETPSRGTTLFQLGRFVTSGKSRSGTNRPAGADCAVSDELKWSQRSPVFRVSRRLVHVS